jgi:hypothetical protein
LDFDPVAGRLHPYDPPVVERGSDHLLRLRVLRGADSHGRAAGATPVKDEDGLPDLLAVSVSAVVLGNQCRTGWPDRDDG